MQYQSIAEIELLVKEFRNRTLPADKWTHDAHLTVALWHLHQYDFYEALCLMKSGIISYNISIGGSNTSSKGYHETLTVFWMKVIDFFRRYNKQHLLLENCNAFLISPLASRKLSFHFYNEKTILSPEARSLFISSDKTNLIDSSFEAILQDQS